MTELQQTAIADIRLAMKWYSEGKLPYEEYENWLGRVEILDEVPTDIAQWYDEASGFLAYHLKQLEELEELESWYEC